MGVLLAIVIVSSIFLGMLVIGVCIGASEDRALERKEKEDARRIKK